MHKDNYDIKEYAKSKGVYFWQIADVYGMHDSNFCKLLRYPLKEENKARIKTIIDGLANEK